MIIRLPLIITKTSLNQTHFVFLHRVNLFAQDESETNTRALVMLSSHLYLLFFFVSIVKYIKHNASSPRKIVYFERGARGIIKLEQCSRREEFV